jgi:hypothetical protein
MLESLRVSSAILGRHVAIGVLGLVEVGDKVGKLLRQEPTLGVA